MAKDGYNKSYIFLKEKFASKENITFKELADAAGYKETSTRTTFRTTFKNKFLKQLTRNELEILEEIESFTEDEFVEYCSQKKIEKEIEKDLSDHLRENSIQAMVSAIEIHNKPQIAYRYQLVCILIINSWELVLKSYISKYMPDVKLFFDDGKTKSFESVLSCVIGNLGKDYFHIRDNLKILYDFRCKYVHYYTEDIDPLLYGLFQKSISNFNNFIKVFFKYKLEDTEDLYILPLGFKRPISPVDYLTEDSSLHDTNPELKKFILNIIDKTEGLNKQEIQETIIVPFSMLYKNEKRLKNADIVAAITGKKDVNLRVVEEVKFSNRDDIKEVNIKEETIYDSIFTETYTDIVTYCRTHITDWKQNKDFHNNMKKLKANKTLHRERFLDPNNDKSQKKDFYSKDIYKSLNELYTIKK